MSVKVSVIVPVYNIQGCDCTEDGYFFDNWKAKNKMLPKLKRLWVEASYCMKQLYPEIGIISINPVGLKGLFKDVYTQSYVDAHPELKNNNAQILNEENK